MKTLITFKCPACSQSMEGEPELEFSEVSCPNCQHQFYPKPSQTKKAPPTDEELAAAAARREALLRRVDLPAAAEPAALTEKRMSNFVQRVAVANSGKIRAHADRLGGIASILGAIGLLLLVASIFMAATGVEGFSGLLMAGAGALGSAFWLYLIAQIVHIRANTEK